MQKYIIKGSNKLKDKIEFDVIPDRIEAGTYIIASALTNENIRKRIMGSI